jgi:DNA-binding CsgD family transcriptional regulator/tetratricopeptide (TPR) repeat protein
LVGRADVLAELHGHTSAGHRSVVLTGAPGVGKTRLGVVWLDDVGRAGIPTARVLATRATAAVPLGAFATVLSPDVAGADEAGLVQAAVAGLLAGAPGGEIALLVDDAQWLDALSCAVVVGLAPDPRIRLVVTVRTAEPAPDAMTALWKDGLAERIDVGSPTREDVSALVAAVIGVPDERVVATLFDRAHGSWLFLTELVATALEDGTLRAEGTEARLTAPLRTPDRLHEMLQARLAVLDDRARIAFDAVVLAEPLHLAAARRMSPAEVWAELEAHRLVAVDEDGAGGQVRLAHPLYGDVGLAALGPLRRSQISRGLAEAHASAPPVPADPIRLALWQLDGGMEPAVDDLLVAADRARTRFDLTLAERLARRADELGGGLEALLVLGLIAMFRGDLEALDRLSERAIAIAPDDASYAASAASRMWVLYVVQGRPQDAERVAVDALARLPEGESRDTIVAIRGLFAYLDGAPPENLIEEMTRIAEWPSGPGVEAALSTIAFTLARRGDVEATQAAARRLAAAPAPRTGLGIWPAEWLSASVAEALVGVGRLTDAEELLAPLRAKGIETDQPLLRAPTAAELARVELARGRVRRSVRHATEAAAVFRDASQPALARQSLVRLAIGLALLGDVDGAAAALAQVDEAGGPGYLRADWLLARAWAAAAGGDLLQARAHAEEAGDVARAVGEHAIEATALHDLARLGEPAGAVARLAALEPALPNPLQAARVAHVGGLVASDPVRLEQAARAFEALGTMLLAAEAWMDLAVVLRRVGDGRAATLAAQHAAAAAGRCEGATTPALAALEARATLTGREREVAHLAASGLSNRDIAERLVVSVRTVESQLQRAYVKLGIRSRGELEGAL